MQIELIVPSNAELPFKGWGANFSSRGHKYEVRFLPSGLTIQRDGKRVSQWDDLPITVQTTIVKTRETYQKSFMPSMCIKDRCYSPVACCSFGYCRELNFKQ